MFFLPSRNRPERLQQALDKIVDAGTSAPGVVVIDGEDPTKYAGLRLPDGWRVEFLPNDMGGVARVWNWCVDQHPDLPWYGMITDDLIVQTPGWDKILIEAAGSRGIASANDLWQAQENIAQGRMHGAAVFGGDLIRAVGYWVPRGMIHNFVDDLWEMIGRSFQCWTVRMDVVTEHIHPGNGKAPIDETYARNMRVVDGRLDFATKTLEADTRTWRRWVECERPLVWDALVRMFERPPTQQVSIAGMSVAVCVPAHDNAVCTQFLQSWTDTLLTLFQSGAAVPNLITLPGESMIMRARNTLVWSFLNNTQAEYLMFIDSDMGWSGASVARLMALARTGKPIVGAAGPRKQENLTFCTRLCGPYVQHDRDTGCVRATELGTGFVLIHREVFLRMMQAFPELQYDDDGRKVWALFDTSIIGGKLFSEDYTFMHRAQKCGFEVWVDPTISLQHVGTKVYAGALGSELARASAGQSGDVLKVA